MKPRIFITVEQTLGDLAKTVHKLTDAHYGASCNTLSGATVGQHVRHIIELFQCLLEGYEKGEVNYDLRKRDKTIETNRTLAIQLIQFLAQETSRPDKSMQMRTCLMGDYSTVTITSTYFREVLYNIEHAIHHMALIRVGIKEINNMDLPETFGVAPSTIKYKTICAQ